MQVKGNFLELRLLLEHAMNTKSSTLHFIPPNRIFMLSEQNDSYTAAESNLFISHPFALSRPFIQSLQSFFKRVDAGRKSSTPNPFSYVLGGTVDWTEDVIQFDDSPACCFQYKIPIIPLTNEMEWHIRLERMFISHFSHDKPYLRLYPEALTFLMSEVPRSTGERNVSREYVKDFVLRPQLNNTLSIFSAGSSDEQLASLPKGFVLKGDHRSLYTVGVKEIAFFRQYAKVLDLEFLAVMERENVTVYEAYNSVGLVIKRYETKKCKPKP